MVTNRGMATNSRAMSWRVHSLSPTFASPSSRHPTRATHIFRVVHPLDVQAEKLHESIRLWLAEALVHLDEADQILHGVVLSWAFFLPSCLLRRRPSQ